MKTKKAIKILKKAYYESDYHPILILFYERQKERCKDFNKKAVLEYNLLKILKQQIKAEAELWE